MFVQVTFNYLNSKKEVVLTRYWAINLNSEAELYLARKCLR